MLRAKKIGLLLAVLAGVAAMLLGYCAVSADIVRVRRADLYLEDLPGSFDGVTLLYAADFDLCGTHDADAMIGLFDKLKKLSPDMLILGGDYTSRPLFGGEDETGYDEAERNRFIESLSDFSCVMGKYAVFGADDADREALERVMLKNGITPLYNERATLRLDDEQITLLGFGQDYSSPASRFTSGECVIGIAHSAADVTNLVTSEAKDGGTWLDVFLTGSTHGGQVNLFGKLLKKLQGEEDRNPYGWLKQGNTMTLTTSGIGCEKINLRLGTAPEVWLITLKKA